MADKPTIILFSHVSNMRSITGAEKLLLFFAGELLPYYDILLVAPQEGKLTRQARNMGITVHLMAVPMVYGMYAPYAGLEADVQQFMKSKEYVELVQWLNTVRPSFVLTSTCVNLLPAAAAKSLGIPVVWKISETITETEWTSVAVGLIDHYSDEIIAISETAASPFPVELRYSKLSLLPPSWNESELMMEAWSKLRGERRRELGVEPREQVIGYISSFINKEKGLEHFIGMAVTLAAENRDLQFFVVGMPGDRAYYERCLKKVKLEGLQSRFHFEGYEECLPAAYCAMDVLVVPSVVREGFGMTALEGFVFAKPVASYDSGGLREIMLAAGRWDCLAPSGDIGALTAVVRRLTADPGAAALQAQEARASIAAAYGPAAYRARLAALAEAWRLRYPPAALPAGEIPAPPEGAGDAAVQGPPPEAAPPAGKAARAGRRRSPGRRRKGRRARLRRGRSGRGSVRARRKRRARGPRGTRARAPRRGVRRGRRSARGRRGRRAA